VSRRLPLVVACAALLGGSARAATPIGELIAHPATYADTVVTVVGTVRGPSVGYQADAAYDLRGDDERVITVFGRAPAPTPGSRVSVTGRVGYRPPDEEFSFPPTILETGRAPQ
jgi:hypothetical protein